MTLKNKRYRWYNKTYILWEIVKTMKDREVIFMDNNNNENCIRGMKVSHIDHLKKLFDVFKFHEKNYNMYISVAKYNDIPMFTFDLKKRSTETNKWFTEESFKHIYEYDIFIDLDNKDKIKLLNETQKLINFLYYNCVEFYYMPSGNNFHVIIDGKWFPDKNIFGKDFTIDTLKNNRIKKFTEILKKRLNLTSICLNGIGVHNKIMKCPYSLVNDRVCLPCDKRLPDNFTFSDYIYMYDCNYALRKITLYNRGLKKFNSDYNNKKIFANFLSSNFLEV